MDHNMTKKHCETKVTLDIESLRSLWSEATDKQRLEMIKSIIWTAPNMEGFYEKVLKELNPVKFRGTLD